MDREPGFAQMVQAKAGKLAAGNIRPVVADAETLDAEPAHFELAVIGNAFHRLDRDLVAARLLHWLRPGGCVALCWAGFETARHWEFPVEHRWSLAELAGYVRSTSFLPPSVLGDQGAAFDAGLAAALGPFAADAGTFPHDVGFVYDLARKPGIPSERRAEVRDPVAGGEAAGWRRPGAGRRR